MAVGRVVGWVLAVLGSVVGPDAGAATISAVSPQGEVAQVRQVVVSFSEAVVPLGDLRQPAPVTLGCQGATAGGTGRWNNDREWDVRFYKRSSKNLSNCT